MTMRLQFSARDRRTLLAGATMIAGLMTLSRGVPVWRLWVTEERSFAATLMMEVARAESLAVARTAIRDSLVARNRRFLAFGPAILPGSSPAAAGAELAGIVSGAVASSGMRVSTVHVQTVAASAGDAGRLLEDVRDSSDGRPAPIFVPVSVRAEATGDILGLTRLLLALERGPTMLALRHLSVTQPEPAAGDDRPEVLRTELVVEGIVLAPQPRAARPPGMESP